MYGPHGHGGLDGWFMMIFAAIFWVLLLIGIIVLVIWLITRYRPAGETEGSALDILQKRYARGEISREEYQRMKQELSER